MNTHSISHCNHSHGDSSSVTKTTCDEQNTLEGSCPLFLGPGNLSQSIALSVAGALVEADETSSSSNSEDSENEYLHSCDPKFKQTINEDICGSKMEKHKLRIVNGKILDKSSGVFKTRNNAEARLKRRTRWGRGRGAAARAECINTISGRRTEKMKCNRNISERNTEPIGELQVFLSMLEMDAAK